MSKKYAALTFDDGPSADTTPMLLELMGKYSITASFFVCGQSINENTAPIMLRAVDMGCEINNHSNTHPPFTELSAEQMLEQVEKTAALVEKYTGARPHFFRPPFISVDQRVLETVELPFICGIGTEDWDESCSAERRYSDIMSQVKDGIIILMHDSAGNVKTVEAVSRIIPAMLSDGFEFVTVSELFRIKGVDPMQPRYVYSAVPQETMLYREQWFATENEYQNIGEEQ